MEKMKSFLIFFYILDQCYDQYMEDDLGGFLGAISPELWKDGQPADKAIYNDWEDSIKIIETQNIAEVTYKFLESYEQRFGLDFKETKFFLKNKFNEKILKEAQEKAEKICQRYYHID